MSESAGAPSSPHCYQANCNIFQAISRIRATVLQLTARGAPLIKHCTTSLWLSCSVGLLRTFWQGELKASILMQLMTDFKACISPQIQVHTRISPPFIFKTIKQYKPSPIKELLRIYAFKPGQQHFTGSWKYNFINGWKLKENHWDRNGCSNTKD